MTRMLLAAALVPVFAGCQPGRLASRYFLSACPAEGPARETELRLHLEPVSMPAYYGALQDAAPSALRREVARVRFREEEFPVYHFGPLGTIGGTRLLVIAGVHGNEIAGALVAPRLLRALHDDPAWSRGIEMHVIAPANPIGLAYLSRYNGRGCDVNRDFGRFRTAEAAAVRDVFRQIGPALVLSLHEGPQDGFYVIATASAPRDVGEAMARAAATTNLVLADENVLGRALATPGFEPEGWWTTALKRVLGIDSLGAYAHHQGVGTLTTESPWGLPDVEVRIAAQLAAVRGAVAQLQRRPVAVAR